MALCHKQPVKSNGQSAESIHTLAICSELEIKLHDSRGLPAVAAILTPATTEPAATAATTTAAKAATPTAAAAAAAAEAAASAAVLFRLSFVDLECPAIEFSAIQRLDRRIGRLFGRHLHESEPA